MLELYHNDMSTCSQKVRLALAEKGQAFTSHTFNLRAGEHKNEAYLKLNPNGVVPTIVHDGAVIIDSSIINEYIDDRWPEPSLRPKDPIERARMRRWTKQLDDGVHAMGAVVSFSIAFRHEMFALNGREAVEKNIAAIPDPVRREFMSENVLKGVESKFLPGALQRFRKAVEDMDAVLGNSPWLAGETYSLADIGLTPYILRLDHLALNWLWDDKPTISSWFERLKARPAYQDAVADWYNQGAIELMQANGRACTAELKALM